MNYNFYILIISILFSSVTNIYFEPVGFPFEVNDGEVKNVMVTISKIWIKTVISRDSQIIMDITCHDDNRVINKEDVQYGKYFKETNKTELAQITYFVATDNKYKITYDVSKDQNDYGIVVIKNLSFNQKLTISVTIVSKPMWWLIIIGIIILSIVILIGLFILCRTFLRCCRK